MVEIVFINNVFTFNSIDYKIVNLDITSESIVIVTIDNDVNYSVIALVAGETIINDVLQTSAQMIYDTLTSNV